jgi:sugar fermentation stimulation protein A
MLTIPEKILFGRLVKRYKRFFMDITLADGTTITAHTPNTGSMLGLLAPGNEVMLTKSDDPKRKTAFTAVAIKADGTWVGINTHWPNALVANSLSHELFAELHHYKSVKREVAYGPNLRSRIDLLLHSSDENKPQLYLEIKNVTLKIGGHAQFPDAVSMRARKHVEDLLWVLDQGHRAAIFFLVQRADCPYFAPAYSIDAHYGRMLKDAQHRGLMVKAFASEISGSIVQITHEIPCQL